MLTRGGAAPNVTDDTDQSKRVGQVSTLWNTMLVRRLLQRGFLEKFHRNVFRSARYESFDF